MRWHARPRVAPASPKQLHTMSSASADVNTGLHKRALILPLASSKGSPSARGRRKQDRHAVFFWFRSPPGYRNRQLLTLTIATFFFPSFENQCNHEPSHHKHQEQEEAVRICHRGGRRSGSLRFFFPRRRKRLCPVARSLPRPLLRAAVDSLRRLRGIALERCRRRLPPRRTPALPGDFCRRTGLRRQRAAGLGLVQCLHRPRAGLG